MNTSVIEAHDRLSVLSVLGVDGRIDDAPGVESLTSDYAAQSVTVPCDVTRIEITDIRSVVRQGMYQPEGEPAPNRLSEQCRANELLAHPNDSERAKP